jgi:hypothetical protein
MAGGGGGLCPGLFGGFGGSGRDSFALATLGFNGGRWGRDRFFFVFFVFSRGRFSFFFCFFVHKSVEWLWRTVSSCSWAALKSGEPGEVVPEDEGEGTEEAVPEGAREEEGLGVAVTEGVSEDVSGVAAWEGLGEEESSGEAAREGVGEDIVFCCLIKRGMRSSEGASWERGQTGRVDIPSFHRLRWKIQDGTASTLERLLASS